MSFTAYALAGASIAIEITLRDDASIAQYGEYPRAVEFERYDPGRAAR